jgi:hypothetical protein
MEIPQDAWGHKAHCSLIERSDRKGDRHDGRSDGGLGLGGFGASGLTGGNLNLVITIAAIVGTVVLVIWFVRRLGREGGTSGPGGAVEEGGPCLGTVFNCVTREGRSHVISM